jgi:hypothetical protein
MKTALNPGNELESPTVGISCSERYDDEFPDIVNEILISLRRSGNNHHKPMQIISKMH